MKQFNTKSRITIGLATLLASVLCAATMLGVIPDTSASLRHGRTSLCESIAISSSDYMSRGEWSRLEQVLRQMVERNDDVLSAGLRRPGGNLVAIIGEHETLWQADRAEQPAGSHVHVPLHSGGEKWGNLEIRFRDIEPAGIAGWLTSPRFRLIGFVTASSYLLFLFYLGAMLPHLEPSPLVPKRVGSELDSLADEENRTKTDRLPITAVPPATSPESEAVRQPSPMERYLEQLSRATPAAEPLRSSCPLDDPEFREVAEEFASRLTEQLTAMREASSRNQATQLVELAHWLKGSGGNAGFDMFTQPAYELEMAARNGRQHEYEPLIDQLATMADRIELTEAAESPRPAHASLHVPQSHAPPKPAPLYSTLPTDDIDFREIVEEFEVRLDMKLTAMEQAVERNDYEELAYLALWLKGSGGTAGFDEFSSPAKILERMAKQNNHAPIPSIIEQLRHLASRIAIEETSG